MSRYITIIKTLLLNTLKLLTPGLLWVLIFLGLSLVTIFVDGDKKILLLGGAYTYYLVIIYVTVATVLSWLLNYLIWKLPNTAGGFYRKIIFFLTQLLFCYLLFMLYYLGVVYFISGLRPWELKLKLSEDLAQQLVTAVGILNLIFALVPLFLSIIFNKFGEKSEPSSAETDSGNGGDSGFGDLISV